MVHLPLFHTNFPANANFLTTFLIQVATFEIIPNDVLPTMFNIPERGSYNAEMEANDYSSMYASVNVSTFFFLIHIFVI